MRKIKKFQKNKLFEPDPTQKLLKIEIYDKWPSGNISVLRGKVNSIYKFN